MTIQEFKSEALKKISHIQNPQLDISIFLETALNQNKTWILMNRTFQIPDEKILWLKEAVEKRSKGLPVAYITGHKEFFGYDFIVSPSVLIPKPDTEILVQRAIELIEEKHNANPEKILTVCDMCTGSGCIAISVFKSIQENLNIPESILPKFTLVDISPDALEIARKNTINLIPQNQLERFRFVQSNLFENIAHTFDIILTNPPYIPKQMVKELLTDGRSEPVLALDGDITITGEESESSDGLEIIRNLIPQAKEHLSPYGMMLMETGEYNAIETKALFEFHEFKNTRTIKDLEGQLRVTEGRI